MAGCNIAGNIRLRFRFAGALLTYIRVALDRRRFTKLANQLGRSCNGRTICATTPENFTDQQKTEIFVLDRAFCSMTSLMAHGLSRAAVPMKFRPLAPCSACATI